MKKWIITLCVFIAFLSVSVHGYASYISDALERSGANDALKRIEEANERIRKDTGELNNASSYYANRTKELHDKWDAEEQRKKENEAKVKRQLENNINFEGASLYVSAEVDVDVWKKQEIGTEPNIIKAKYTNSVGDEFVFGYKDVWNEIPLSERELYERKYINNGLLKIFFLLLNINIQTTEHYKIEYFKIDSTLLDYDYSGFLKTTTLLTLYDGNAFVFQYRQKSEDGHMEEFEKIMNKTTYSTSHALSGLINGKDSP